MKRFVGTWRLESFEYRFEDGSVTHPVGTNPVGLIIYDSHGNMAVQYASSQREPFAGGTAAKGTVEEKARAFDSFKAYFGAYVIDDAAQTVTHQVTQGSDPNYSHTDQVRHFQFVGDLLILETSPREVDGRTAYGHLEWRRVAGA